MVTEAARSFDLARPGVAPPLRRIMRRRKRRRKKKKNIYNIYYALYVECFIS